MKTLVSGVFGLVVLDCSSSDCELVVATDFDDFVVSFAVLGCGLVELAGVSLGAGVLSCGSVALVLREMLSPVNGECDVERELSSEWCPVVMALLALSEKTRKNKLSLTCLLLKWNLSNSN